MFHTRSHQSQGPVFHGQPGLLVRQILVFFGMPCDVATGWFVEIFVLVNAGPAPYSLMPIPALASPGEEASRAAGQSDNLPVYHPKYRFGRPITRDGIQRVDWPDAARSRGKPGQSSYFANWLSGLTISHFDGASYHWFSGATR